MTIGLVKVDSWASIHQGDKLNIILRIDCDPNLFITHPVRPPKRLFDFAMARTGLIKIFTIASRLPALDDWQMRPDEHNEDQYVIERLRSDREEPESIADGLIRLPEGWREATAKFDNWTRVYVTNKELPAELEQPQPDKELMLSWLEEAGATGWLWGGVIHVRI